METPFSDQHLARPVDALGLPPGAGNCGPVPDGGLYQTWFCEVIDPHWDRGYHYHNGDYVAIEVNSGGLATIAYERLWFTTAGSDANLMVAQQRVQVFLPLVMRAY